jgi:hypothetical protein
LVGALDRGGALVKLQDGLGSSVAAGYDWRWTDHEIDQQIAVCWFLSFVVLIFAN